MVSSRSAAGYRRCASFIRRLKRLSARACHSASTIAVMRSINVFRSALGSFICSSRIWAISGTRKLFRRMIRACSWGVNVMSWDELICMPPFHGCLYGKEVFRLYRCWNDYSGPCQALS